MNIENIIINMIPENLKGFKITRDNKQFVCKDLQIYKDSIVYTTFNNDIYKMDTNSGQLYIIRKDKQYYLDFQTQNK